MSALREIFDTSKLFVSLPVLETERLKLRKLSMRDSGDMFEYASVPEMTDHVSWEHHRSVADSMHFLRIIIQQYEFGNPTPWGIVYKENNKLIGTIGFHYWLKDHMRAEVGFALSKDYWNHGLMTEALTEVLRFGFDSMRLNRIEGRCELMNAASERVMNKCGMKLEGILRQQMFVKGVYKDLKFYSIIRDDRVDSC